MVAVDEVEVEDEAVDTQARIQLRWVATVVGKECGFLSPQNSLRMDGRGF